jgi:hypothetical protein
MASTFCQRKTEDVKMSSEENKKISTLYHERNLEDIDKVLGDDFVGYYYQNKPEPIQWNKEGHRNSITNYPDVDDSIMVQVAEGDWVATRFKRTVKYDGKIMSREGMQFKQIKNGKIIRSWELFSPVQETEK